MRQKKQFTAKYRLWRPDPFARALVFILIFMGLAICDANRLLASEVEKNTRETTLEKDIAKWETYINQTYDYEIRYPKRLKLWLTGSKGEREGRGFAIAYPDVSVPNGLSFAIFPGKSAAEIRKYHVQQSLKGKNNVNADKIYEKDKKEIKAININGIQGIGFEMDNVLFFYIDDVYITFFEHAEFDRKIAEDIISTFKYPNKGAQ